MAPGNRAIEMLAAFYAEREKERMGLGADTIEAFTEGPYRRAEQMRVVDREKIEAIVKLRKCGVPSAYLYFVANLLPRMDVFEACAAGTITAEEGGWLLFLMNGTKPWYVRLALWIAERAMVPGSDAP
jgi:hypothetical protein